MRRRKKETMKKPLKWRSSRTLNPQPSSISNKKRKIRKRVLELCRTRKRKIWKRGLETLRKGKTKRQPLKDPSHGQGQKQVWKK